MSLIIFSFFIKIHRWVMDSSPLKIKSLSFDFVRIPYHLFFPMIYLSVNGLSICIKIKFGFFSYISNISLKSHIIETQFSSSFIFGSWSYFMISSPTLKYFHSGPVFHVGSTYVHFPLILTAFQECVALFC